MGDKKFKIGDKVTFQEGDNGGWLEGIIINSDENDFKYDDCFLVSVKGIYEQWISTIDLYPVVHKDKLRTYNHPFKGQISLNKIKDIQIKSTTYEIYKDSENNFWIEVYGEVGNAVWMHIPKEIVEEIQINNND
jgi:hypothetical protein